MLFISFDAEAKVAHNDNAVFKSNNEWVHAQLAPVSCIGGKTRETVSFSVLFIQLFDIKPITDIFVNNHNL